MVIYGNTMVILWEYYGNICYPLVNVYITVDPPCLMGKSTMSMAIFNSYVKLPRVILM